MKDLCEKLLKEEGYAPKRDEDGDIIVKAQGVGLLITSDDDISFLRVWLPNFWEIESEQEYAKALYVANKLNADYRVAKIVYMDNRNMHIMAEYFIDKDDAQFKEILMKIFQILPAMRFEFANLMRS